MSAFGVPPSTVRTRTSFMYDPKQQNSFMRHTYRSQLLDVLVRRAKRGQPDLLRELRELRVGQHRKVTQQVVDHITEN